MRARTVCSPRHGSIVGGSKMVKARRPSRGLGHLPVRLHPPKEPTVPFFPSFLFLLNPVKPSPIAEAIFPDSVGLSIRVKP